MWYRVVWYEIGNALQKPNNSSFGVEQSDLTQPNLAHVQLKQRSH
jgi:hypothetical protein